MKDKDRSKVVFLKIVGNIDKVYRNIALISKRRPFLFSKKELNF